MATEKRLDILIAARDRASRTFGRVGDAIGGIARRLTSLPALVAGAIGGAAIARVTQFGIASAAAFEQSEVALTTLLGSAEKAKRLLADMTQFAATTPFQFPELVNAARNLIAFGVAQEHVLPTLKAIGDVAAGVSQPIGEIAEIYGKARVQGRLFSRDINQLTRRGIPIIAELAKQFGVAESEVRGLVESGRANFGNLQRAFADLTAEGGKFAGLMEAQSHTASGLFSTLKDNLELVARDFGQELLPALKSVMTTVLEAMPSIRESTRGAAEHVMGYVRELIGGFQALTSVVDVFGVSWGDIFSEAQFIAQTWGDQLALVFAKASLSVSSFLDLGQSVVVHWHQLSVSIIEQMMLLPKNLGIAAMNMVQIARNLLSTLGDIFAALWDSISTGSLDAFKDVEFNLLKGVQEFATAPEFEKAIIDIGSNIVESATTKSLREFVKTTQEEIAARRKEFDARRSKPDRNQQKDATPDLASIAASAGDAAAANAGVGPANKGLAAVQVAQRFLGLASSRQSTDDPAKKTATNTERTAKAAEQTADKIDRLVRAVERGGSGGGAYLDIALS